MLLPAATLHAVLEVGELARAQADGEGPQASLLDELARVIVQAAGCGDALPRVRGSSSTPGDVTSTLIAIITPLLPGIPRRDHGHPRRESNLVLSDRRPPAEWTWPTIGAGLRSVRAR